ncbi:glycosyltransferase family 2 protein [Pedobacter sp. SYP-B3415]|uniref:glycosyltransferase family 2 protein n=1 Tax=Pedobacter sp. SYP-B3415 TaxID=2496641 RepID=UPI0013EB5F58|nr:glycosyltransferase family 2 protein [Pedobacter sp. SYP-B3415]
MNDKPLVSVALCTYNGSQFLKEQLDSLLAQDWPLIEIIAVDDCSTDDTFAILTSYALRSEKLKIYRNDRNLGYTRNFEQALRRCQGDLVAICDQDDIWSHDKLSKQVAALGQHILVYCDSAFVDKSGRLTGQKMSDYFHFYSGDNPDVFLLENCISGHAMLFKKSLIGLAGSFPSNIYYDQWLAYVATNHGSVAAQNEVLVLFRRHEQNSTDPLRQHARQKGATSRHKALQLEKLQQFGSYNGNKSPGLVNRLIEALRAPASVINRLYLVGLLLGNMNTLFFVKKKHTVSKINYCLKYL